MIIEDRYNRQEQHNIFRVISYIPLHIVKFLKSIDVLFLFRRSVVEYYFQTFGYIGSVITIEKAHVDCEGKKDFIIQTMILNPDPKFRVTSRTHVPGSHGVLLIFDKQSLREEEKYYEIIDRFIKFHEEKKFPVMLVLLDDKISSEEIRQFNTLIDLLKKKIAINYTHEPLFFKTVLEISQKHAKQQLLSFISKVFCDTSFSTNFNKS